MVEGEVDAEPASGRVQHAQTFGHDFLADAVPGDDRDPVLGQSEPPWSRIISAPNIRYLGRMKRIVAFLAVFVLVAFGVLVIRETAAVVALARDVHPLLGQVTLWTLLSIYAVCLGVPIVLFMRLPRPLTPPASESDAEFPRHLARLRRRLVGNPHLRGQTIGDDRAGVAQAIEVLDRRADLEIRKEASLVFLSTAISQSGRLDGLFVLVVQARLIWKIAHVYGQRASFREMLQLYANVAVTVFAAESIEDLEIGEVVEPLIPPLLEAAGVGATVVLAPVATILADALFQGTVNSLLTFRVGCIAKRYSAGMPLPAPKAVRRAATREAATMLGGVIVDLSKTVTKSVWDNALNVMTGKARTAAGRVRAFLIAGPAGMAIHEAVKKMATASSMSGRPPREESRRDEAP
jgi:hypothetical protein